jgi:hypothetical protein
MSYAYKEIEDFEKITGYKVNDGFRIGWNMARTTNKMLGIADESEQEWTPEYVKKLVGVQALRIDYSKIAQRIAAAHKAALAAAYAKGREHNDIAIAKPLREQLAAEQEKYGSLGARSGAQLTWGEVLQDEIKQLRKQLAAEQQATSNAFTKGYDQGHADALTKAKEGK